VSARKPEVEEVSLARVTGFEKQSIHNAKPHPTETECDWTFFEHAGQRYLQISSSGSKERKSAGVTQTYQFDLSGARELKRIVATAFPELA
jgi:hypothetical protein